MISASASYASLPTASLRRQGKLNVALSDRSAAALCSLLSTRMLTAPGNLPERSKSGVG